MSKLDFPASVAESILNSDGAWHERELEILAKHFLSLKKVFDAAKNFTSGGDMVEGFHFTKEDEENYLNLRIAVDGARND